MHTIQAKNTVFIFSSDLSGEIIIRTDSESITIDGNDMILFMHRYINDYGIRDIIIRGNLIKSLLENYK